MKFQHYSSLATLLIMSTIFIQPQAWAKTKEWELSVHKKEIVRSIRSTAHLEATKEEILLINTLSLDLSLGRNIAFPECHYPVDLKPFTSSLFAHGVQFLHLKKTASEITTLRIRVDPKYTEDFAIELADTLSKSEFDTLVIEDSSENSNCITTQDHAVIAIAGPKIDARKVYLVKNGTRYKVSLYDWIWQIIWTTFQVDAAKSAVQLFESLGRQLQAHLPIEQSQLKPDNCQSD